MIGKIPSLDDALRLEVIFVMPRPKNHYGRRGLKPKAPFWHNCRPDCGKLVRALEDALTGTIWKDDAQVVQVIASKIYGEICGAHIWIKTIHSPDKAVTKSLPVPLSPDSPDRSRA
jgi:Holliday junction resolvase RusA-like endonuclease